MRYRAALLAALQSVTFELDELAFLALTSKPELQVRDRMAWRLYEADYRVAREWAGPGWTKPRDRLDLALLDGSEPLAVCEAKACYTFDTARLVAADSHRKFPMNAVLLDLAKMRRRLPLIEIYLLVVQTHVLDPVPPDLLGVVKFQPSLRRVADKQLADGNLRRFLDDLGRTSVVTFPSGTAFDVSVSVSAWFCGPVPQVPADSPA